MDTITMAENDTDDDVPEPKALGIVIHYGHPSGAVQAYHPKTGTKQLGDSPGEAVDELWRLLKQGGVIEQGDAA